MVNNSAENGVEIQYRLPAVRDCHIDENQTQALSHEEKEMETYTQSFNGVHIVSISAENGVKIHYHLAAVSDCHIDENRTLALSHKRG